MSTVGAAFAPPPKRTGPRRRPALRSQAEAWQLALENRGLAFAYVRRLQHARPDVIAAIGGPDDALQVAALGLFAGCERWDESRGVQLSTYCWRSMSAAVGRAYRGSDFIRVPEYHHGEARAELRRQTAVASLNRRMSDRRGDLEPACEDADLDADLLKRQRAVRAAVRNLPEQERLVVRLYYLATWTLEEIADRMELSKQRVHQILQSGLERLRQHYLPADLVPEAAVG